MSIFFDHNSTTPMHQEVLKVMSEIYPQPLNSSAIHKLGRQAQNIVEHAKNVIKKSLNADNYEIIFTSGATESCNQVIFASQQSQLFYSTIEHACIDSCKPNNKAITYFPCDNDGIISLEKLDKILEQNITKNPTNNKDFIAFAMLANNETGAIQPAQKIAQIIHQKSGLFFCDIVQAVGKIKVDLEEINADFACLSAHKINAVQGIGALLVRKNIELNPLIFGGKQQQSKRAGTLNIAGIAGFAKAMEIATNNLEQYSKIAELRDYMENQIKKIAQDHVKIFCENQPRLANTSLIALANCDSQTQIINFDLSEIYLSAGSTCSSGTTSQSRILQAMNCPEQFVNSAIRVSLGLTTTKTDIEKFISVWNNFYQQKFFKK
ncbi:MAG: cysteine desulfurase family protein [Alphaproteobacteria bacterium]